MFHPERLFQHDTRQLERKARSGQNLTGKKSPSAQRSL